MLLLQDARDAARLRHLSSQTEKFYLGWTERYVRFSARRTGHIHPQHVAAPDVEAYLNHLASSAASRWARRRRLSRRYSFSTRMS